MISNRAGALVKYALVKTSLPNSAENTKNFLPHRGKVARSAGWGLDGLNKTEPPKSKVNFLKITNEPLTKRD